MSQNITFNGVAYVVPSPNDTGWGPNIASYLVAIAAGALQKTGGNFALLADVNFGASYGLISTYFKSRTANVASAGAIRLASSDTIKFRNAANTNDVAIDKDSNDDLRWLGIRLLTSGTVFNADVNINAAIALSKLAALTASKALASDGSGVIAVTSVTATELGYLSGVTSAIQTQLNGKEPTVTKGNLTEATSSVLTIANGTGCVIGSGTTIQVKDAASGVAGVVSTGAQTVTGAKTFETQLIGKGTATNDDAAAGYIGEYVQSVVSNQDVGTTGEYSDITSISLTAGDWDVSVAVYFVANGATITSLEFGVGTATGNNGAGLVPGDTNLTIPLVGGASSLTSSLPIVRKTLAGTTTIYLKQYIAYSVATPKVYARISARRVR